MDFRKNEAIIMSPGIFRLGANIENGDLFEGMWSIPDGVSLNSYLLKGDKTALIDMVSDWDNAPNIIEAQLQTAQSSFEEIDYLILNHIEPDHTGWLDTFCKINPRAIIVTTQKGVELIKNFYKISNEMLIVSSGDSVDLGNEMILEFFEIPNVHWPETMVTYEKSSKILFSCDAFGSYGSVKDAFFDDQLSKEEHAFFEKETLRYYANIVGSFSIFVQKAIKKLEGLEIKMIAPSHGIIWRENPSVIIERYLELASFKNGPAKPEITVIWGSMYGNTAESLNSLVEGIRSEKVTVHIYQTPNDDISYILASAWKSSGLVFGMPTYEYKMFPPTASVIDMFERKHINNKKVFRFGSYGWSGGAQKELDLKTSKLKWDFIEPVEYCGFPTEDDKKLIYQRGKELAICVKEMNNNK